MNKISCGICRDLIPLVADEVAGEESKAAVEEHIRHCESCRKIYEENEPFPSPDDEKMLRSFRRYRIINLICIILFGALIGVSFAESQKLFYNILIMPTVGAAGVLAFGKKGLLSPLLPAALFFIAEMITAARVSRRKGH